MLLMYKTNSGFIYISSIIDNFNGEILAHGMSYHNDIDLIIGMLNKIKLIFLELLFRQIMVQFILVMNIRID